jgi:hypothetical protein
MTVDDHGATTGNGYVTHTCQSEYKGREQRTGYTTISTIETTPKTATVEFIQLGKTEYVEFDSATYNATAAGGQITITGRTNSTSLAFALTDANSMGTLPATFSIVVGGTTTGNQAVSGQTFANDPGATQEIAFTIVVTIAANSSISSRYCTLTATAANDTDSCNIIQAAGESYLWVDEENTTSKTITFSAAGLSGSSSSVDVDVLCNETWEVDVHE